MTYGILALLLLLSGGFIVLVVKCIFAALGYGIVDDEELDDEFCLYDVFEDGPRDWR